MTLREREIVEFLACGYTADEVAERLDISTYTVRNHLRSVYSKARVKSLSQLIATLLRGLSEGSGQLDAALADANVGWPT